VNSVLPSEVYSILLIHYQFVNFNGWQIEKCNGILQHDIQII